ncbi:MAG: PilX N-terminal domain-containing pilus assembly protein [candidate division Zixibacteria bacterium]|nr:PilX N-terminal domain-containing pilus assembly protein [candidate division Zixibacteria bacterium]
MNRVLRNNKGIALFIALMLTLMLSIIGLGIIKSSNDEVSIAGNELNEMKCFYVAEAGLDKVTSLIQSQYDTNELPPTIAPAETTSIDGIALAYSTVPQASAQKTLTKGSLAGLKAFVRPYKIQSTAYDSSHNTSVVLEEWFEVASVPIFQFAVFYDNDLEIAPGAHMDVTGRVHSNGDLYVQSEAGTGIDFDSYITAYGSIYHGRKPGSGLSTATGDVNIKNIDGTYMSMRQGSGWLDAADSYWYDTAAARWGGRVQDNSFGQERLTLPLENPDDPHTLIDRYDDGSGTYNNSSMELDATLKIIDGVALYNVSGTTWIDVTSTLTTSGALLETTFYDKREEQNATVYDIDVAKLSTSGYFPSNGIVYTADDRTGFRATRLYNATDIGAPFTLASENPVYTKGNINTTDKQPMAIMCDAITVLSGNWSDAPAKAASADKTQRPATSTTINFSYITGNKNTGSSVYNGGLENLPRFLENWSTRTLTYRGSIVNMWLSEKTSGIWSGAYYNPPSRDWEFDTDLNDISNLPPGTPAVRAFIRWGWKQTNVGYTVATMNPET